MAPLRIFGRKKRQVKTGKTVEREMVEKTLLQELCGDDNELYEVLNRTILLNPELSIREGIHANIDKAQEYENAGDVTRARVAYQAAGEISLYEGKLSQVQKFFKKAAEVDPSYSNKKIYEYYANKEDAERAMKVAQEYYSRAAIRSTGKKEA